MNKDMTIHASMQEDLQVLGFPCSCINHRNRAARLAVKLVVGEKLPDA